MPEEFAADVPAGYEDNIECKQAVIGPESDFTFREACQKFFQSRVSRRSVWMESRRFE